MDCMQFNLSHRVEHLSFGIDYPGQVNPLDRTEQFAEKGDNCIFAMSCLIEFSGFFFQEMDILNFVVLNNS